MKRSKEEELCKRLLNYDPEVVEVVLFGSSVYAPERAKDVDLLVFTRGDKDRHGYLNAVDDLFGVDVVVMRAGEPLEGDFAWHVLGAYQVLYGDGRYLREATSNLGDPPFEGAWAAIEAAQRYIQDAEEASNEALKDIHTRNAFNQLFHAARLASMAYLATEETRWGRVKRMLSPEFADEFEDFIDILHVEYFYHGKYPKERARGEFEVWLERARDYVKHLIEQTRE
ncbi:MAG TPA: nucleotidyltransferase domain-containing protein [Anaerolineae bacterium]|nr:nucleotidyltransferase domain-containing protein [Anaerolineae bacterium]